MTPEVYGAVLVWLSPYVVALFLIGWIAGIVSRLDGE